MSNLYVVGTPIGNLEDITLRAIEVLKSVDMILCEDTRVTKKLLSRYKINTPVKRLDAHTENSSVNRIVQLFKEYTNIALVSDAGTPTISDPGNRFIKAARDEKISIISIPGPSAVISALSVSGLPASDFLFLGFLPHKKGRETLFNEIANSKRTVVFYESPHRIIKTLESLEKHLSKDGTNRTIVIARELTKVYEEVISASPQEALAHFVEHSDTIKGEFVIIVDEV